MAPEKRRHPRLPIALDVFLEYPPLGMVRGTTRNVSLEGMFVETGHFTVPRGATVQVALPLERGLAGTYRFRARVVHSRPGGVGLVLHSAEIDAMRALDRWLRAAA